MLLKKKKILKRHKLVVILMMKMLKKRRKRRRPRMPDTNSALTGSAYVDEILEGNPAHSVDMLHMEKQAFIRLCELFRTRGWLENSRYISVEEQMAMFLTTLGQHHTNRTVKRRYQHSTQTVHTYFYKVLHAMLIFSKEMIVPNFNPTIYPSQRTRQLHDTWFPVII